MVNSLSLSLNKTYYMQFKGTCKPLTNTTAILDDIQITNVSEIKFLGVCVCVCVYIYIYIHNTINWKDHVEHIIPILSRDLSNLTYLLTFLTWYTTHIFIQSWLMVYCFGVIHLVALKLLECKSI
jgi:hypothetical protein